MSKRYMASSKNIRFDLGVKTYNYAELQNSTTNNFERMANEILNGEAVVDNSKGLKFLFRNV